MVTRGGWMSVARLLLAASVLCLPASNGNGEEPPVSFLYINQERLLTDSAGGKALLAQEQQARNQLVAEARRIDTSFEAEELELTELRAELEPDEFRELADDFDERVVAARAGQDERSDALGLEPREVIAAVRHPVQVGVEFGPERCKRVRRHDVVDDHRGILVELGADLLAGSGRGEVDDLSHGV